MKHWLGEVGQTWLGDNDLVAEFDRWVRARLVHHRRTEGPTQESVAPWTVDVLVRDIKGLGHGNRWLWCTSAISLLAELVFCADAGGPFPSSTTSHRYDLNLVVGALRTVRNATLHPAFQLPDGDQQPPIRRLYNLLDNDDDQEVREAAYELADNWSFLAKRPITSYALRQLNSGGRLYGKALGLPGRWE